MFSSPTYPSRPDFLTTPLNFQAHLNCLEVSLEIQNKEEFRAFLLNKFCKYPIKDISLHLQINTLFEKFHAISYEIPGKTICQTRFPLVLPTSASGNLIRATLEVTYLAKEQLRSSSLSVKTEKIFNESISNCLSGLCTCNLYDSTQNRIELQVTRIANGSPFLEMVGTREAEPY